MKKRLLMLLLATTVSVSSIQIPAYADSRIVGVEAFDEESTEAEEEDELHSDEEYEDCSNQETIELIEMYPEEEKPEEDCEETDAEEQTEFEAREENVEVFEKPMTMDEYMEEKGMSYGAISTEESYGFPEELQSGDTLDRAAAATYPVSYDPRNSGKVSGVRDQVGGTCWLYSVVSACESNLIHKGYADSSIDLSELQIAYFLNSGYSDPLGIYTENTTASGMTLFEYMDGGLERNVVDFLSTWTGPVMESEAVMPKVQYATDNIVDMVNATVLDESLLHKNYWQFQGARFCDYDTEHLDDVKRLITEYGGVTGAYYSSGRYYETMYEGGEATYYFPSGGVATNHAVEIVGWDDNFSKDNFIYTPPGDGAWLIKNSLGNVLDMNGVESNGYLWLSYYEKELKHITAVDFDNSKAYENMYAYDGGRSPMAGDKNTGSCYFSTYEAKAYGENNGEMVNGVMLFLGADTTYEMTLYANPVVENGELVGWSGKTQSIKGVSDYAGYYTIDLGGNALYVTNGDTYGIVVKTDKEGGLGASLKNGKDYEGMYTGNSLSDLKVECYIPSIRALTNKAEGITLSSYVCLSEDNITLTPGETAKLNANVLPSATTHRTAGFYSTNRDVAVVAEDGTVTPTGFGECDIIATAYDGQSSKNCHVTVKCTSVSLENKEMNTGESFTLEPAFTNGFTGITNEMLDFNSSDPAIANVDASGNVTASTPGTVEITAALKSDPTVSATCQITVSQKATGISLGIGSERNLFTGQTIQLNPVIVPGNTTNPNVAYSIKEGAKTGIVDVTDTDLVSAKSQGSTTLVVSTTDGTNLTTEVTFHVLQSASEIITCGWTDVLEVNQGETVTAGFYVSTGNENFMDVLSVTSSDAAVAEVVGTAQPTMENGWNAYYTVQAKSAGTAYITIKSNDGIGATLTYTIIVKGNGQTQQPNGQGQTTPNNTQQGSNSGNRSNNNNTGNNSNTGNNNQTGSQPGNNNEAKLPDRLIVKNVIYRFDGDTLTIEKANLNKTTYTLYSYVNYKGKRYKVTKIADNAFKNNKKLKKLTIPSTITEIGENAFYNCKKLKSITIPSKVTKIGEKAFYKCSKLKEVVIKSKKLKSVGKNAFGKIYAKATVQLPKSKYSTYQKNMLKNAGFGKQIIWKKK